MNEHNQSPATRVSNQPSLLQLASLDKDSYFEENAILNTLIEIHDEDIEMPFELFSEYFTSVTAYEDKMHFGIIHVNIVKQSIYKTPIMVLLSADCSASMMEVSYNGVTKIQHIIHTIINMLRVFANTPDLEIYVGLDAFDDTIYHKFGAVRVTSANVDELAKIVSTIEPCGSTNIELALKNADERISLYRETNPTHRIAHILLTDGEATKGELDHNILANIVNDDYMNIFIGYGKTHDSDLLQKLSNKTRGDYRFVDKLENAGLVCGELLHGLLYPAIENACICLENGEIYDWKIDKWTSRLNIPAIHGGSKKTYHIRTRTPDRVDGFLYGNNLLNTTTSPLTYSYLDKIEVIPELIGCPTDLRNYMFRQRTQELLFQVREFNQSNNYPTLGQNPSMTVLTTYMIPSQHNEFIQSLRNKVKEFFDIMSDYIKINELTRDKFMKILLDDIYIAYKTLGTRHGLMYSCARQTSQGRQQTYNVTDIDNIAEDDTTSTMRFGTPKLGTPLHKCPPIPPRLVRTDTCTFYPKNNNSIDLSDFDFNDSNESGSESGSGSGDMDNNNLSHHILSPNADTPYATPSILSLMRAVSEPDNTISSGDDEFAEFTQSQSFA